MKKTQNAHRTLMIWLSCGREYTKRREDLESDGRLRRYQRDTSQNGFRNCPPTIPAVRSRLSVALGKPLNQRVSRLPPLQAETCYRRSACYMACGVPCYTGTRVDGDLDVTHSVAVARASCQTVGRVYRVNRWNPQNLITLTHTNPHLLIPIYNICAWKLIPIYNLCLKTTMPPKTRRILIIR